MRRATSRRSVVAAIAVGALAIAGAASVAATMTGSESAPPVADLTVAPDPELGPPAVPFHNPAQQRRGEFGDHIGNYNVVDTRRPEVALEK